jgi:hypothetical protein
MRVRFTADYNHHDGPETTAFKEGMELTVTKEIGQAAVKTGRAVEAPLAKEQDKGGGGD